MTLLADTLFPAAAPRRTVGALLRWWESRRLLYNVVVGVTGLLSLAVVATFASLPPAAHFRIGWQPIAAYALMANLCYSLGWLIETAGQRLWQDRCAPLGPVLFR